MANRPYTPRAPGVISEISLVAHNTSCATGMPIAAITTTRQMDAATIPRHPESRRAGIPGNLPLD